MELLVGIYTGYDWIILADRRVLHLSGTIGLYFFLLN